MCETDGARTKDELQTGQLCQGWKSGHTEATGETEAFLSGIIIVEEQVIYKTDGVNFLS